MTYDVRRTVGCKEKERKRRTDQPKGLCVIRECVTDATLPNRLL